MAAIAKFVKSVSDAQKVTKALKVLGAVNVEMKLYGHWEATTGKGKWVSCSAYSRTGHRIAALHGNTVTLNDGRRARIFTTLAGEIPYSGGEDCPGIYIWADVPYRA